MAVERYGSKTDVIVKLVLVFFIALLSFSIGTFVGKKFSDNQHKLAVLEPDTQGAHVATDAIETETGDEARGVASVSPDANEVKPDKALSDDEIAKLAEEFVIDDEKTPTNPPPTHLNDKNDSGHTSTKNELTDQKSEHPSASAEPTAPTPKAAPTEALKPAQRMAEGKSPVVENPSVPSSRIPSSLPKEVAASDLGKFTIQIGAYGTEKEAQTKTAELKSKGYSSFYVSAQVNGKTWYRVSLGLFSSKVEAETYLKTENLNKKFGPVLIQKISKAE